MSEIRRERVEEFLKDPEKMEMYRDALALLQHSGMIDLLTWMGMPKVIAAGSDVQMMATQAAWSNGWQSAVENLVTFESTYRKLVEKPEPAPEPTYGSKDEAVLRGLMSAEELKKVN